MVVLQNDMGDKRSLAFIITTLTSDKRRVQRFASQAREDKMNEIEMAIKEIWGSLKHRVVFLVSSVFIKTYRQMKALAPYAMIIYSKIFCSCQCSTTPGR